MLEKTKMKVLITLVLISSNLNIIFGNSCQQQVSLYNKALNARDKWALKMWDSTGKVPDGLLEGNNVLAGIPSSCNEVHKEDFKGRFCAINFGTTTSDDFSSSASLDLNLGIPVIGSGPPGGIQENALTQLAMFGMCFPDGCLPDDISEGLQNFMSNENVTWKAVLEYCKADDDKVQLSTGFWIYGSFIILVIAIMFVGTLVDILHKDSNQLYFKLLTSFSLISNVKKLMNTQRSGKDNLESINGMRAISCIAILCFHALGQTWTRLVPLPWYNFLQFIRETSQNVLLEPISNIYYVVDTFFFMSGLLVTLSILRDLDKIKNNSLNTKWDWLRFWLLHYIHRYLRLTCVLVVIMYTWVVMPETPEATHFATRAIDILRQKCAHYGWRNILYIQTYFPDYELCGAHLWYLATDFQLFLLSPLLIYPLWRLKTKKAKIIIASLCMAVAILIPMTLTIIYDWPFHDRATLKPIEGLDWSFGYYYAFWCRSGPFIVGICLGYFMHERGKIGKPLKLSWIIVTICWIVAFATGLAVVYGTNFAKFYTTFEEKSKIENVLYNSFARPAWGICCAWVIFACSNGYGGIIATLLSWKVWMPIAKLAYVIYIVHPSVGYWIGAAYATGYGYTNLWMTIHIIIVFISSALVSFFFVIAIEFPFGNVEKLLLPKSVKITATTYKQ